MLYVKFESQNRRCNLSLLGFTFNENARQFRNMALSVDSTQAPGLAPRYWCLLMFPEDDPCPQMIRHMEEMKMERVVLIR